MPSRVPRKPRPKKTGVPKGYDSIWEYEIHQTLLKDWKHHWDNIDYIVKHKYEPDFVKIIISLSFKPTFALVPLKS